MTQLVSCNLLRQQIYVVKRLPLNCILNQINQPNRRSVFQQVSFNVLFPYQRIDHSNIIIPSRLFTTFVDAYICAVCAACSAHPIPRASITLIVFSEYILD